MFLLLFIFFPLPVVILDSFVILLVFTILSLLVVILVTLVTPLFSTLPFLLDAILVTLALRIFSSPSLAHLRALRPCWLACRARLRKEHAKRNMVLVYAGRGKGHAKDN